MVVVFYKKSFFGEGFSVSVSLNFLSSSPVRKMMVSGCRRFCVCVHEKNNSVWKIATVD